MMMHNNDIRWIQRFENYCKALAQLTKFMQRKSLNELEEQGLIKAFEYNFELAWKVLKDLLAYQGIMDVMGSRDAFREAFKQGLLGENEQSGQLWLDMIKSRNLTTHTYDEAVTQKILVAIIDEYFHAFIALRARLQPLAEKEKSIL